MNGFFQTPGNCMDETCCKAQAPEQFCRCHISDRLSQLVRLRKEIGRGDDVGWDDATRGAWKERLRVLTLIVLHQQEFDALSETSSQLVRLAEDICACRPLVRGAPFTAEELEIVRRMDRDAGIVLK